MDFWNDAPLVGGCIAGRRYIHITSKGDVEPCIFTHFSVDNIKNKSLIEVLNSDFFKALRAGQPNDENLLLPCMLIDNPKIFRKHFKEFGLKPTHPDAVTLVKDKKLMAKLDKYSEEVHEVYKEPWKEEKEGMKGRAKSYRSGY